MLTTDGFRLGQRMALIAGSGHGIGHAIAECFAAECRILAGAAGCGVTGRDITMNTGHGTG